MRQFEEFLLREEEDFFSPHHSSFFSNPFPRLRGPEMFHRREFPMLHPRSYYDDEPLMLGPPESFAGPENWGNHPDDMGPDELKVQLLPNNRMRVSGNRERDYHDNGRHVRSRRWFQQSMDVPEDVDVARLRDHMDENNQLRIVSQKGNSRNGIEDSGER